MMIEYHNAYLSHGEPSLSGLNGWCADNGPAAVRKSWSHSVLREDISQGGEDTDLINLMTAGCSTFGQ